MALILYVQVFRGRAEDVNLVSECVTAGVCEIGLDYFLLYTEYLIVCLKRWDVNGVSRGNLAMVDGPPNRGFPAIWKCPVFLL